MKFVDKHFGDNDVNREIDRDAAHEYYQKMIEEGHPYVCLLYSDDWTSSGYWVEGIKKDYIRNGYIISEYFLSEARDKKIDKLISK